MKPTSTTIIICLLLVCGLQTCARADCPETLAQTSTNADAYLGLHPAGPHYGVGQLMTLSCDYRFETIDFRIGWGPAVGDVRSLTTGDTLFCDIRKADLTLIATAHVLIPDANGLTYLTFDFTPQDVLLPADDYLVTVRTNVDAAGGVSYCNACTHDGTRYYNENSGNPTAWVVTNGDLAYSLTLDADVTPVENSKWSALKADYWTGH